RIDLIPPGDLRERLVGLDLVLEPLYRQDPQLGPRLDRVRVVDAIARQNRVDVHAELVGDAGERVARLHFVRPRARHQVIVERVDRQTLPATHGGRLLIVVTAFATA